MKISISRIKKSIKIFLKTTKYLLAKINRKYYYEDYVRVYPHVIRFTSHGKVNNVTPEELNNFLNHQKFYFFAAQFANNKRVVDIGCGSGYGCAILKNNGSSAVYGSDASKHAIYFAKEHFGHLANFSIQNITSLKLYNDSKFDLAVCSEVLEHIKEYGKEDEAILEIKRITLKGGIIVIGTPNSEMLGDHGFSYDEIHFLISRHFFHYCIFENALIPFASLRPLWERRLSEGRTGVIVTEAINLKETVIPAGVTPQLKQGIITGVFQLDNLKIDTTLLHNTHSWIIVAINQ